jgi:4-amino-4-deoxy-L-arabinose transferase-like glycosyltransferase
MIDLTTLSCDKEERQLFTFLAVYLAAWTLLAAWLPLSMDLDSVEQVIWSQTAQWGYYKHPPLPSLLLHILNKLFGGPSMGLTAFAAQGGNVVALIYVWLLAKRMLPPQLAIVAVLITSLIGYHNFRAIVFNHNTVSLPFTAATLYYFYCAIRQPERLLMWLLLGIAGGLAMLTKYSAILVLASVFVYVVWQRLWLNPLVIRGLLVSIVAFALVFSPHIIWLVEHDWIPFTYLDKQLTTSGGRLKLLGNFFANQGIRWWYTLLAVGLLIKISPRQVVTTRLECWGSYLTPTYENDRRFLFIMLFTPLLLAMLPLLIKGNSLNSNWVSAFFLPAGILLVQVFFRHYDEAQLLKNTQRLVWGMQSVILLIFFGAAVIYPAMKGRSARTNYPSQALANTVSAIWREHQQQPLTIVIAENWLGGNVLLHVRPEPTLLIDNDTVISPWVTRQDVASCGALVLTSVEEMTLPTYSTLFNKAFATGTFALNWGHPPRGEVVQYAWAIQSPEPSQPPCRFNSHVD